MVYGMGLRAFESTGEQQSIFRAGHDAAGPDQKGLTGLSLQLGPQLEGASDERDVQRMLIVCLPDDARVSVGGAHGMRGIQPIERDDACAPSSERGCTRAAHGSESDDTYVEIGHL